MDLRILMTGATPWGKMGWRRTIFLGVPVGQLPVAAGHRAPLPDQPRAELSPGGARGEGGACLKFAP